MLKRFGLVLCSALCLAGCGSDGDDNGKSSKSRASASAVLTDAARVLDEGGHAALRSFGADGRLAFSGESPVLSQLASGQVLIVSVTEATPHGALVMVEDVTRNGTELVVQTRRATLDETFEELHLDYAATLTVPRPEQALSASPGMSALQQGPGEQSGLAFPLRLGASSASGSAQLEGSLSVAPEIDLAIDIDFLRLRLKELSLSFGAAETFTANFTARGTTSIDESVTLASIPFTPIMVPVPGLAFPIVLTPVLSIDAGVSGGIAGTVEASVIQEASFELGLGYRNGSFGTISDHDSRFDVEQPTYDASANVRAAAGPRFEVLLWGLVGPYARAEAYVALSANAEGPPPCVRGSVDAGIDATVGVEFVADHSVPLFNQNYPLAHFDSCTNDPNAPRPAPAWARSFSRAGSPGERAKAVVQLADGTYFVAGDSDVFGPVTGFAASIWALRLDALGNVMWQRAYMRLAQQGTTQAAVAVEDGLLVLGAAGIMKLDVGGNLRWAKTYSGPEVVNLASLDVHPDGQLVACGRSGTSPPQAFAMGLDANGDVLWSHGYGGSDCARVRTTRDGGSVLVGRIDSGNGDLYAVKLDARGGVSWKRAVDNAHDPTAGMYPNPPVSSTDGGYDIAEKSGGGYIAVGETYGAFPIPEPASGGYYAAWEIELGADGSLARSTVHRAPNDALYTSAYAVALRPDDRSLIVGRRADRSTNLLGSEDILLIQGGTYTALGGAGNDAVLAGAIAGRAMPIQLTKDGGVIIAGTTTSMSGQDQFWVVKLGRTANIDFPYRTGLAGSSYTNEHARSIALSVDQTQVQLSAVSFTADMLEEVTPVTVLRQTP